MGELMAHVGDALGLDAERGRGVRGEGGAVE